MGVSPEYVLGTVLQNGGKSLEAHPCEPKIRIAEQSNPVQNIIYSEPPDLLYKTLSNSALIKISK